MLWHYQAICDVKEILDRPFGEDTADSVVFGHGSTSALLLLNIVNECNLLEKTYILARTVKALRQRKKKRCQKCVCLGTARPLEEACSSYSIQLTSFHERQSIFSFGNNGLIWFFHEKVNFLIVRMGKTAHVPVSGNPLRSGMPWLLMRLRCCSVARHVA